MIVKLRSSSMQHVADRVGGFLLCQPPFQVVAVRPNGVAIHRPDSVGIKGTTYFVCLAGSFLSTTG